MICWNTYRRNKLAKADVHNSSRYKFNIFNIININRFQIKFNDKYCVKIKNFP